MSSPNSDEIVELIGELEAISLLRKYAGSTIYFPKVKRDQNYGISQQVWDILCDRFGGTQLFIPKGACDELNKRNREIIAYRKAGASITDCCIKFKLTDRQIRSICNSDAYK